MLQITPVLLNGRTELQTIIKGGNFLRQQVFYVSKWEARADKANTEHLLMNIFIKERPRLGAGGGHCPKRKCRAKAERSSAKRSARIARGVLQSGAEGGEARVGGAEFCKA